MSVSLFKTSNIGTDTIDVMEAYNLWNSLRARYTSIEMHQFMMNLTHDRDLYYVLNTHLNIFAEQVHKLEKMAAEYKVKTPSRPPSDMSFTTQLSAITDRSIFHFIFLDIAAELFSLNRTVITSATNDRVRTTFQQILMTHLSMYENHYKYGKLKGWTEVEPAYKTNTPVNQEQLSVSEAHHIWDHTCARYDQIEFTQFVLLFAHDPDYKLLLKRGLGILRDQIDALEKIALQYEVPLPERPPSSLTASVDPETMEDRFTFRTLLTGIQYAVELHLKATVETTRNDKLRQLFMKYLSTELDLYGAMLKYGRTKGWLRPIPTYKPS